MNYGHVRLVIKLWKHDKISTSSVFKRLGIDPKSECGMVLRVKFAKDLDLDKLSDAVWNKIKEQD